MNKKYLYIALVITLSVFTQNSILISQIHLIPKIGWTYPTPAPTVGKFEIDSKNGILMGLEARDRSKIIYFNPGLYFLYNRMDINQLDSNNVNEPKLNLHNTETLWMKLNMGMALNLIKNSRGIQVHIRNGISSGILIKKPDFKNLSSLSDSYRKLFIEYHIGIGLDLQRVIINADYHLSFVRRIAHADFVENTFTINIGYLLQNKKL